LKAVQSLSLVLILALTIYSQSIFARSSVEKIIGEDDLVAVSATGNNIPLRFRSLIDAFGHMSMGCSATHIGNGYVLTAGHCFYAGEEMMIDADCSDTTIEWGLRENKAPYLVSKCETIIAAQRNDQSDFAIIKVSPVPPVAIAPDIKRKAILGDSVTIFSHPEELPLRWSRICGVERVEHPEIPGDYIQHKCDTNPGSSGATIIDAISLKIIGIHDGGVMADDSSSINPVSSGMNYGTYLLRSPIAEILKTLGF
jgi:V8-like Glu-specific endopeptidase